MILNDKNYLAISQEKPDKDEITTAYLDYFNIIKIKLTNSFDNIEFLSLKNNNLQNLDFIQQMPKIYYLDLRNNPVYLYL
jgi:hypothetical protein